MRPKVLVTGAAGFIGSHLVDRLLSAGHSVIGLDRRSPRANLLARLNLADAMAHSRFHWVEADLASTTLGPLLDGVDCVFHLAAIPGVRRSWGNGLPGYVRANVLATGALLAGCERAGVRRLVYASSSSVYGPALTASRETHPTLPLSPYGVTKLAGEQLCLAHALRRESRLSVVALRYFTVYGPRQRPDMAISRMLAAALTAAPYTVFGDGRQRREFTYVSDVVDATLAARTAEATATTVNVGGGASVPVAEVLRLVEEVTGNPVLRRPGVEQAGDTATTAADLSAARLLLGYQPRVDLPTGLTLQAEWLRGLPASALGLFIPSPTSAEEVPA